MVQVLAFLLETQYETKIYIYIKSTNLKVKSTQSQFIFSEAWQ